MAALFTAASTQYLVNSAPAITGYPFCVGMWINLTAVNTVARTLFALSDTATTNHYLTLRMAANETMEIAASAGATEAVGITSAALTPGAWAFILGRFLSSTNRRMSVLHSTGQVELASNTTSRNPSGMDTMTLGALSTSGGISAPWDGLIGEFWLSNADIFYDTATNMGEQTRQFAYGGPFSVATAVANIVEYRSMRAHETRGDGSDLYFSRFPPSSWVNTNGATISYHPPLPYWYVKPGQTVRNLIV